MAEMTLEQQQALALANARLRAQQAAPSEIPTRQGGMFDFLSAPFEMGAALAAKPRKEQVEFIAPTVEALGTAGGAMLGAPAGPLGSVAGAGTGYAASKELLRWLGGTATPETLPQASARVAKEALTGATMEAGGRAVIGPLLEKAAKAAGWTWDAVNGRLVQMRAGKVMRQIAGADLDTVKALAASAEPELTAAQATAGAKNDLLAAMGERAAKNDVTNFFGRTAAEQEAARKAMLQSATPDMAAALEAQAQTGKALYGRAYAADAMRRQLAAQEAAAGRSIGAAAGYTAPAQTTPALDALRQNPIIAAAAKEARTLAASQGTPINDPMASLEGLHLMKVAIDNQFKNRTASTALQNFSDAALSNTKNQLLGAIEGTANAPGVSPLYGAARRGYAEASAPVNQARILTEMQNVLAKPGGGERVTQFLNVLGQGENALLKRANQQPRFGGIEEALTPEQMQAVNKVASEMTRDMALAQAAQRGKGGLARILGEAKAEGALPPSVGLITRVTNKVLSTLEGRVNEATLRVMEDGMRSGKSLSDLLNALPASERSAALRAIQANAAELGKAGAFSINALREQTP